MLYNKTGSSVNSVKCVDMRPEGHIHAFNGRTIFPTDRADGTDFSHAVCSFPIDEGKEKTGALAYDARSPVFIPNRSLEKVSCHFLMTAIRKTALYLLDL